MKLSISNIAWDESKDLEIYSLMHEHSYRYLEIAPTRIFPTEPYNNIELAAEWAKNLLNNYNLKISSMQSIWYGRTENIFSLERERNLLIEYSKKAINFAEAIGCKNLVFGCSKNRKFSDDTNIAIAIPFFEAIGNYAYEHNSVIGLEANPKIYDTNYINTTGEAINLIKQVNSPGFKLNLDIGTIIANNEEIEIIEENINLINHVHISEPYLQPIKNHLLHKHIAKILKHNNYNGCVSIEMKNGLTVLEISKIMEYVKNLFS